MRQYILSAVVLLSGCAGMFPTVVPEATSTEFKPLGEVTLRDRGAAFDLYRVRGPKINLSKRTDGSWGGTLKDAPVDVSTDETTIRGVDLLLSRSESTPGHVIITGQFQGNIVRFEFDDKDAKIRTPGISNTFYGRIEKDGLTSYGPGGPMMLKGQAGTLTPPWPQLGLALLGSFI